MKPFCSVILQAVVVSLFLVADAISDPLAAQTGGTPDDLLANAARRNPTVAIVLEMPRQSPAETLTAVFTLLDLGEDRVAVELLRPLLKRELTGTDRARLVDEFGTAKFLRLMRLDRPAAADSVGHCDGACEFAQACLKAAHDAARNPKRIARLIGQLNDGQPAVRNAARVDLEATGIDGVKACLLALAELDSQQPTDANSASSHKDHRARLMAVLVALHPEVDGPLLAALAGGDGLFRRDLAEVAGHLRLSSAVPWLAQLAAGGTNDATAAARQALANMGISTPTPAEARALAIREIDRLEEGVSAKQADSFDQAIWWTWTQNSGAQNTGHPAAGQIASHPFTPAQIQTLAAARLARAMASCGKLSPSERQLVLIYHLEAAAMLDYTLPEGAARSETGRLVDELSTDELSATLAEAIRRRCIVAATTCAKQLGRQANRAALASHQGRASPLARALGHADARLRFAALSAVMQITPQRSFAGASYLPDALWNFAAGSGPAQAVVVAPILSRASDWAGQLRGLGYDAIPTNTGRSALQAALGSSRLAMVIIDAEVSRPAVREVLYQLRSSIAAGRTPVAVVCAGEQLNQFEQIARAKRFLLAAVRPSSEARLVEIVQQLHSLAVQPLADNAERTERAKLALKWLAELLETNAPYHELRRRGPIAEQTLYQPELAKLSLLVLKHLGTADSQRVLVDYASSRALPIENRRAAAAAFGVNVDTFGNLLTNSQINEQYQRYNTSETADRDTQQVLGQLLDLLESKDACRAIR